ncbi:MAG TPA: S41 family peptidase, partial [Gemmatimonadales bacterium]|nr:S41 family peptidase [Gemmatimonadales bacterium]
MMGGLVYLALSAALTLALAPSPVLQTAGPGPDTTIDASTRTRVIQGVLRRIEEGYIFPDKAKEMAQAVQRRAGRGEYDSIVSARAFAERLTGDLRAVSHDRHLEVAYIAKGVRDEVPDAEPTVAEKRERAVYARRTNWGFERVERLSGNVGYLEIRSFDYDPEGVDSTLSAAMDFLANTDALIVDVRRNGGGEPLIVAAVCSYLMPPNTLINKFYWRPQNRWDEFRTKRVTGKYYGTIRPVYVLTSDGTFSGAEEFAYDIQTQKRGEVVGDTTGGGAHPGGMRRVTEQFGVWVPAGRAINPVTGKNWEGTGVIPDVPVAADEALRTAHLRALKRIVAGEKDPEVRTRLQQV